MSSMLFRDSQLTNGSKLVLMEPVKHMSDDEDDDEEGGESEMEEGGEDEIDEENQDASDNENNDQNEAGEGEEEEKAESEDHNDESQSKGAPLGFGFRAPQQEESELIKNPEGADDGADAKADDEQ